MPIYVYAPQSGKCRQCDGSFEVYQKVADAKLKTCPDCGKKVERVISAVPVHGKFSTKSDSRIKDLGMVTSSGQGYEGGLAGSTSWADATSAAARPKR